MSMGGLGAGISAASNAYNSSITQAVGATGIVSSGTQATWLGQPPIWNENMHQFNCQKVENGWTLEYRNKQYIAADLDSLMDQIKAAMVMERIEK